ncbi:uncharacterized protein LOC124720161 isoform X6 [Schistocerca piceifrons]|uniref:uncharacterized protein LOC124720161 isoform X6 n=1 Tax=Schistocerca piceifrons TaxID=274613 RepID=UPI001F5FD28D|nr:uncharacterized protein LOC124720161 isoform X6 [Schistocerca piceifrons]
MNVKEELEESVNKEFLEDPLKAGDPSVCIKQDPELKHHAAGSEHNSVEDPLGISLSTDFIKEDPELNITENTVETSIRCASDSASHCPADQQPLKITNENIDACTSN